MIDDEIRGEHTLLRAATSWDLDLLVQWLQDPDVSVWWGGKPLPREEVAARYTGARRPAVESFIVNHNGQPVGYLQARLADRDSGALDMFLIPSARGRGLGPDAARALARHLVNAHGWRRLTVDPSVSNVNAIRAWRRAGFRIERELPDARGGPGLLMVYRPGRIHIVGGPGSGKTTLAAQLGQRQGVPVYDLDAIAYEGGAGRKRELAARHADVERIAQTPGWVTEGIYLWWCDPLAEKADCVVWLDVPWRVAVYRIVRRHIVLSLAGTNRHPGVKKLARFAWGTRRYYLSDSQRSPARVDANDDGAITRARTAQWLMQFGNKVTRRRNVHDLSEITDIATNRSQE